jgi:hypothetical protein
MAIDALRSARKAPFNLATGSFLLVLSKEVIELVQEIQFTHYNYTSSIGDFSLSAELAYLLNLNFLKFLSEFFDPPLC